MPSQMSTQHASNLPLTTHNHSRQQYILSLPNQSSLSHIFGSKQGGAALGAFIAASQASVRPRRKEPLPEGTSRGGGPKRAEESNTTHHSKETSIHVV